MTKKTRISVCVSTRKPKNEVRELDRHIRMTAGCDCEVMFCFNDNMYGLSAVYYSFMNKNSGIDNILVFVHDDVEFVTLGWGRKLLDIFNGNPDYGIIGLAGTRKYTGDKPWWLEPIEYKVGQVIHREQFKGMFLTKFSENLEEPVKEVVVIDGLFMAADPEKIKDGFDPNLQGFHFYDIDFCLRNRRDDCKVGVTTEIRVVHNSVGKITEEYSKRMKDEKEKYKEVLPIILEKTETLKEDSHD